MLPQSGRHVAAQQQQLSAAVWALAFVSPVAVAVSPAHPVVLVGPLMCQAL
jgi:hypothetical protein